MADDIPEHAKRAVEDARRAIEHLPPRDVLDQYQRAAEEAQRALRSVPAHAIAHHTRAMEDMRRAVSGLPRVFLDQQQQMVRTFAAMRTAAEPQYSRILREISEAQRHALGSASAASLSMVWAAELSKMQPAWLATTLAAHKSLAGLLGDTLSMRVMTSLSSALQAQAALSPLPSRLLSQLATRQVAMATMIGADWMRRLGAQPTFAETFGGRVLHSLGEIAHARGDAERDAEIEGLQTLLRDHGQALPRSPVNLDGWAQTILTILFMLLLYLLQSRDGTRDTDRIVNAIRDLPGMIAKQEGQQTVRELPQLSERLFRGAGDVLSDAPVVSGPMYVATRRVNVRLSRSVRSPRLVVLHRGQAVERIEKRRKWVHVTYFDFVAGEQRDGWVFSKYLRPIQKHERKKR